MANYNVLQLTSQNFTREVEKSSIPVLVDFWAPWCGPCKAFAPTLDKLADKYDGKVKIGKVNVDEDKNLSAQYKIMSIPTLLLFKDGQLVKSIVGAKPAFMIERLLLQIIKK